MFSWGIVFWEVLTRRLPFDDIGGNELRVLWAIHSGQRPPKVAGCPKPLEDLVGSRNRSSSAKSAYYVGSIAFFQVDRCWHKEVSVRPTMQEVVQEMEEMSRFFPGAEQDPLQFPEGESLLA